MKLTCPNTPARPANHPYPPSDDFEVAGVGVVIHNAGGVVLEQGAAMAAGDGTWNYTATTDLPGHKTTKSQTKS